MHPRPSGIASGIQTPPSHALWHPRPVLLVETKSALLGQSGPNFLSSFTPFFFLWHVLTDAGTFFAMSNRSCSLQSRDNFLRT
jgi:hypothetical protein